MNSSENWKKDNFLENQKISVKNDKNLTTSQCEFMTKKNKAREDIIIISLPLQYFSPTQLRNQRLILLVPLDTDQHHVSDSCHGDFHQTVLALVRTLEIFHLKIYLSIYFKYFFPTNTEQGYDSNILLVF